jgi:Loader and inhibitor of phage G40P
MKETLKLLTTIQASFPIHKDNWEDESQIKLKAKMWHIHFAEYDFEEVFGALVKYVSTGKFPPTIADLKQIVAKNRNPEAFKTGENAWEEVIRNVKRFGYYQQEKAFESFDAQTKRLVQSLGWGAICQCQEDKIGIMRSNFVKMWESIKFEEKEAELIPVEVLNRLKEYEIKRLPNS